MSVRLALVVAPLFFAGTRSFRAQSLTIAKDRPKFDVVSIKVNKNLGSGSINLTQAGGLLTASNVSLKFLIIQAYQPSHIHFAPNPAGAAWIDSEHFDVEAEVEGNPTVDQKRLMIQSLLADRFHLHLRSEVRQLPEYALRLSKAGKIGPQLRPHNEATKCVNVPAGQPNPPIVPGEALLAPCGGLRATNGDLVGQNVTMDQLAGTLRLLIGEVDQGALKEVVDQTGLAGTFDVSSHFQANVDGPNAFDPSGPPSIFTALREQLGLKLGSTKGPVEVLVIDHVEEPTPN